jgi:hypothetical protein
MKSGYFRVKALKTLSPDVLPCFISAIGMERQYMQVALEGNCKLIFTLTTKRDWFEEFMKIERTFSLAFLLIMLTLRESNQVDTIIVLTKVETKAYAQVRQTDNLVTKVEHFQHFLSRSVRTLIVLSSLQPYLPPAVSLTF